MRRKRSRFILFVLCLCVLTLVVFITAQVTIRNTKDVDVVKVKSSIGVIPSADIGINTTVWDSNLLQKDVPSLLSKAGIHVLRFPGGSTADVYHWKNNSVEPGQNAYAYPHNSFDNFMQLVAASGSQAMITVNYGTGSAEEAASWVAYANVNHEYNIKYWEIGNEVYGNGEYGSTWETDYHEDYSPQTYAENALQYIRAMKSVDPRILIGVVLVAPGQWPDGIQPDWNRTVLSILGKYIDFVDIHWYPQSAGQESDKGLLDSPKAIHHMVQQLQTLIDGYCGPHADQVKIVVSETNSVAFQPGKQTVSMVNGMFLADSVMTWLENGVTNVDWWDLHNQIVHNRNNNPNLFGTEQYGDYGVLSSGTSSDTTSEPPLNTPFPTYYALKMLSLLAQPGDKMLQIMINNPLISAHAVEQTNGDVVVLIINKDPHRSHRVRMSFSNFPTIPITKIYSYGPQSGNIVIRVGLRTVTMPPYSMMVVVFKRWI